MRNGFRTTGVGPWIVASRSGDPLRPLGVVRSAWGTPCRERLQRTPCNHHAHSQKGDVNGRKPDRKASEPGPTTIPAPVSARSGPKLPNPNPRRSPDRNPTGPSTSAVLREADIHTSAKAIRRNAARTITSGTMNGAGDSKRSVKNRLRGDIGTRSRSRMRRQFHLRDTGDAFFRPACRFSPV